MGPTENRGSRIVVRCQGQQSSQPFHHAAPDAFLWAIEQGFRLTEEQLRRVPSKNPDVKIYAVVDGTPE